MSDQLLEHFQALRVVEENPGNFQSRVEQMTLDTLPEGELLVEVHYSSLNYKDALSASGNRGVTRAYPHTPGIDASGRVLSDKTGRFQSGDEVVVTGYDLGMNTAGGLGQLISIPSDWAVPLPKGLSLREVMIFGTAGLTAALCIQKLQAAGAKPDDGVVAVTGATGGVGTMAVAMLAQQGFQVAAITGKLEASSHLAELGATSVIDRASLDEEFSKPMSKPRWAHGIDTLGGDYLFTLIKSLHYGGSVAACGLAANADFQGNVFPFILRGNNLLGVDSVELPLVDKAKAWGLLAENKLPNLGAMAEQISLKQVPQYLDQLLNGQAMGRYVVALR